MVEHLTDAPYLPGGAIYFWEPWALWLDAIGGTESALVCLALTVILVHVALTQESIRADVTWRRIYYGLATIFGCGFVVFGLEVATLWYSAYWLRIYVKIVAGTVGLVIVCGPAWHLAQRLTASEQVLHEAIEDRAELQQEIRMLTEEIAADTARLSRNIPRLEKAKEDLKTAGIDPQKIALELDEIIQDIRAKVLANATAPA